MKMRKDISDLVWNYIPDSTPPMNAVMFCTLRVGSWEQIKWLFAYYGKDVVLDYIKTDYFGNRTLPNSVLELWALAFWPQDIREEFNERLHNRKPTISDEMKNKWSTEVAKQLREAIDNSGLTQQAFSKIVGTSQPRLSSYLNGKVSPSAEFLLRAKSISNILSKQIKTIPASISDEAK